jgi:hypothetical protein
MQPYFFPYIGYFMLFGAVDKYVFFDTPQYERRGWMNRNRIFNIKEQFTYIKVPIEKSPQDTPLNKIIINDNEDWRGKIISQLVIYKKIAPFYYKTVSFVKNALDADIKCLSDLNIHTIKKTLEYLDLNIPTDVFSETEIQLPDNVNNDEYSLLISKALGADRYINAIGGLEFFDRSKFSNMGIDISFLKPRLTTYEQIPGRVEPGLSIIDVMMYNSPEKIRKMITDYELV